MMILIIEITGLLDRTNLIIKVVLHRQFALSSAAYQCASKRNSVLNEMLQAKIGRY
jgi:hypothetical protein